MDNHKQHHWGEINQAIHDYADKKINDAVFRKRRILWGLHQSPNGSYMLRFRFAEDGLTSSQARQMSHFIRKWIPSGKTHITTRRNLQVYGINLGTSALALADANSEGLSTYQSGGMVVRSVALCERAGYCLKQTADSRPLTHALENWLGTQSLELPRKLKIAISGCAKDCAFAIVHDFGLVAVRNPQGETGYRFLAGGGLGRKPHRAKELESFVPEKEAGSRLVAAIGAFRKLGAGRPRAIARLKFLLDEIGVEKFRKAAGEISVNHFTEQPAFSENWHDAAQDIPEGGSENFLKWKKANIVPTNYPGRFSATVQVPKGWITGDQLNRVAEIADFYSDGRFKLTSEQNILFPALSGAALEPVFQRLEAAGLAGSGVNRIWDFTSCPGKDYCRGSEGYSLASDIEGFLAEEISRLPEEAQEGGIKVSGCLNQCGRTGLASFGLAGDWRLEEQGPRRIAHLFLGGGLYENGSRMAKYAGWIHMDQFGTFLREFFEDFRTQRREGETFKEYCLRASEDTSRSWARGVVRMDKLSDQAGFQFESEC